MGGVFWRGENWEVVKSMASARLKMEDVCNLYNVIEPFLMKKNDQGILHKIQCFFVANFHN
jgi:hypothetical protein